MVLAKRSDKAHSCPSRVSLRGRERSRVPAAPIDFKIVLWFDNDVAGHIAEDKISTKLGTSRTYVVRNDYPDLKDANDFLIHAP